MCFYFTTNAFMKMQHRVIIMTTLSALEGGFLGSNIGVFAITYAIGKEFSNPIDFRSSKIHFDTSAYF